VKAINFLMIKSKYINARHFTDNLLSLFANAFLQRIKNGLSSEKVRSNVESGKIDLNNICFAASTSYVTY
jgi:hypothetical protein